MIPSVVVGDQVMGAEVPGLGKIITGGNMSTKYFLKETRSYSKKEVTKEQYIKEARKQLGRPTELPFKTLAVIGLVETVDEYVSPFTSSRREEETRSSRRDDDDSSSSSSSFGFGSSSDSSSSSSDSFGGGGGSSDGGGSSGDW